MKNHIYVVLLLVLATLTANAQNGAKGKFLTTYQKNGQEEAVSSGGIIFVKDNTSERYAWQPSAWQQSDYPTLGEAFDIKHVKSIFRYVESDNQFTVTLPEEAPVTEEDVIVEAYGQEITPTEDNVYTTGASSVSVVNEDGKTIYDCYVSLDDQDTQRSIEINALETAYTLLLPIFPHIYETTSDEILTILKSLLAELPETHALAEAIDRSIVKNGYFDIDDVETEYQAAIDCIVEKTGLRNNYLKPGSDNPRRRVTPQQPAVINGNGVYGYKLVMNSSKWVHNDLGKAWNCNLTAYNSNRFAYTAWVRGWKGSDGLIYSKYFNNSDICQNLNNYDILRKSLLKPQRVSTFMGTFTSWDGIGNYISDSWKLFTKEGFGFDDMTWDCTKKTFDMSFTTSNDVVIVLGPADNDLMMYYNVLKSVIDPIIKKVAKKLTNAEDEDYMLNFCIDLLADEDYRSDFYSIFDSNKMFSTKAKEILVLTWPKMETYLNKILCEYLKTKGEQFVWDHFGWVSAMALEESLQKVKDNWNKYLKIVEKVGDVSLGILGLFEGSYYYDLALDFDDIHEKAGKTQYDAAMTAIAEGTYYIVTEVNGIKFYLTTDGRLTNSLENRGLFAISKASGGKLYDVGINIDPGTGYHFTNTTLNGDVANLHPGTGAYFLTGTYNRNDWERQVFFLSETGKFAIRTSNTAYGTSDWADAGRVFWTYEVDETGNLIYGDDGLMACYSYEPAYIWELKKVEYTGFLPSTIFSPEIQWTADIMVFNDPEKYESAQVIDAPPSDANGNEWYAPGYQLTNGQNSWSVGYSPFLSEEAYTQISWIMWANSTYWSKGKEAADIYLRRSFTVDREYDKILFSCSHDDASEWYLNGVLIHSALGFQNFDYNTSIYLTPEQRALIHTDGSKNVLAIHVHNDGGPALADGGFYGYYEVKDSAGGGGGGSSW